MKNNKVSIIVPIYNREKTLPYCIESISNQSYQNFEALLIDDGSSDKTSEICRDIAKKDKRFKYYYKENGGVSSARNLALSLASGDYISFVDSDDIIDKDFIKVLVENAVNNNCAISAVRFNFINDLNAYKIPKLENKYKILSRNEALINLVNGNGFSSACANKMYSKNIIKDLTFQKVAVAEDLFFNFEILEKNDIKVVFSDAKLYNYYIETNDSVMHGKFSKKNLDILKQYDLLMKKADKKFPEFINSLKKSYVFISMKLLIKIISSNYYDENIIKKCLEIVDNYKKLVYSSNDYSVSKKLFLIFFDVNRKGFCKSFGKNNFYKKMCLFLNKRLG